MMHVWHVHIQTHVGIYAHTYLYNETIYIFMQQSMIQYVNYILLPLLNTRVWLSR